MVLWGNGGNVPHRSTATNHWEGTTPSFVHSSGGEITSLPESEGMRPSGGLTGELAVMETPLAGGWEYLVGSASLERWDALVVGDGTSLVWYDRQQRDR